LLGRSSFVDLTERLAEYPAQERFNAALEENHNDLRCFTYLGSRRIGIDGSAPQPFDT